ncbi:L,D-transpeptidase family protein [Serpentinicella alkaliphila]|uniref:Putative peptidoglycan binding protein n=1 Tax=Serpentinicella alkaliphila TaxID=1734049 RepID=A0A4R2TF39_9FIRM|nr:L,D-transpeptidase family protein [Serpentinicella alkaliphila]QUH25494.1 L,D-transpeptidase family protein [Serpentinicella alkaliphila]TCP99674.1 putative peptidoglycan binding protein [Serpentinicella alkaliphila]
MGRFFKILLILFHIGLFISFGLQHVTKLTFSRNNILEGELLGEYVEYNQWEVKMIKDNPEYENIKILIDISENRLYLLDGNVLLKSYTVATGKPETPTPIGSWKVVNKNGMGGGFGTRWMGLNVPWGQFGIHGTNKPTSIGHNASAGCIRMRNKDVEDLYKYVKHGTPVAIIRGYMGPFGYGIRTIKPGDFGSDVMEVQKRMRALGYYDTDYLDGKYGPLMEMSLYAFQKDNGLPKSVFIDLKTYEALGIIFMD